MTESNSATCVSHSSRVEASRFNRSSGSVLLEILACPEDKGPLFYFSNDGFLYNPRLHRKYIVRDGIPVMLSEESVAVDAAEHTELERRIVAENIRPTFA